MITDDSIIVDGNAKINLTLDILGKRPDGYHEVAMVMQSINLHDTLTLSKIPSGIELTLRLCRGSGKRHLLGLVRSGELCL